MKKEVKEVKVVKAKTIEAVGKPWTVDIRETHPEVTEADVYAINDQLSQEGKYLDTLFVTDEQAVALKNIKVKFEFH